MLKYIALAGENQTSVDLAFEHGHSDEDIFRAIVKSLQGLYPYEFLDELVDKPLHLLEQGTKESESFFDYYLDLQDFNQPATSNNKIKWGHKLIGKFSRGDGVEEKKCLGFIDMWRNNWARYNLRFSIKAGIEVCREHAQKYKRFVDKRLNGRKNKPVLYIVQIRIEDPHYLRQFSTMNFTRDVSLFRRLKRIDSDIDYPFVLITPAYLINHNSEIGSSKNIPRVRDRPDIDVINLHSLIERPYKHDITDTLTGVADNSVRTVAYLPNTCYEAVSPGLKKELQHKRIFIEHSITIN